MADGNSQLQQLIEVAQTAAAMGDANATVLLANISGISAVQQGALAPEIRSMSAGVASALQTDVNYIVPASITEELKAVSMLRSSQPDQQSEPDCVKSNCHLRQVECFHL